MSSVWRSQKTHSRMQMMITWVSLVMHKKFSGYRIFRNWLGSTKSEKKERSSRKPVLLQANAKKTTPRSKTKTSHSTYKSKTESWGFFSDAQENFPDIES